MLRTSPGGKGRERAFLAGRGVVEKAVGCESMWMLRYLRLVCKVLHNQLFILNVNLWGKLAYVNSSCQKY